MKPPSPLAWLARLGWLNFVLTNRIPRRTVTRLMGWLSKQESEPLVAFLRAVWGAFAPLDLSDAAPDEYRSLHAIFTRRLREGARPICPDPHHFVSPCDALIGATGRVTQGQMLQAKGMAYPLAELLDDAELAASFEGGIYVTLRLTSVMYHRVHAPRDCLVEGVVHHQGDTWNVNPPALARVAHLFCKNERAVLKCRDRADSRLFLIIPVAAITVAALRLHCVPHLLNQRYRGTRKFICNEAYGRGDELGWFEHGSTVIVIVPPGWRLVSGGGNSAATVRMGEPLLRQNDAILQQAQDD